MSWRHSRKLDGSCLTIAHNQVAATRFPGKPVVRLPAVNLVKLAASPRIEREETN